MLNCNTFIFLLLLEVWIETTLADTTENTTIIRQYNDLFTTSNNTTTTETKEDRFLSNETEKVNSTNPLKLTHIFNNDSTITFNDTIITLNDSIAKFIISTTYINNSKTNLNNSKISSNNSKINLDNSYEQYTETNENNTILLNNGTNSSNNSPLPKNNSLPYTINSPSLINKSLSHTNKSVFLVDTESFLQLPVNVSKVTNVHFYKSSENNDRTMFNALSDGFKSVKSIKPIGVSTHNQVINVVNTTLVPSNSKNSKKVPNRFQVNNTFVKAVTNKNFIKSDAQFEHFTSGNKKFLVHNYRRRKFSRKLNVSRTKEANFSEKTEQEPTIKRNKVFPNNLFSVEDPQKNTDNLKKNILIQQAAGELKSVLNKKNISPKAKSNLLSQIFDDKGDDNKAKVATEIFREALEPSSPTHGEVGDLGAEMIKVSVVAQRKTKTPRYRTKEESNKKRQKFSERLKGNPSHRKTDLSENIPELDDNVTGEKKSKLKINASNFEWDAPKEKTPKRVKIKKYKNEKNVNPLSNLKHHVRKHLHNKTKSVSSLYMLLKNKGNKINMKGRSAKLLSVKESGNNNRIRTNSSNVRKTRKDLVIELDDDMDNNDNKYLTNYDPIMNLIKSFAKNNHDDDIAIIDDRDANPDDEPRNSNDIDDGFISPNRRRIGENLFLESFAENEPAEEAQTEETGVQRSILPEESFVDDNYESKLDSSYLPVAPLESTDYDNPAFYEQTLDDQEMSQNSQSIENPLLMEIDSKRRHAIPFT